MSVRGVLGVGPTTDSAAECMAPDGRACCNHVLTFVVVGGAATLLGLAGPGGFACEGDESRTCCDAPAYGQIVVASGRLEPTLLGNVKWYLAGASLCLPN